MTRDTKQTTKLNDTEKSKLEKLAEAHDCNQSALMRQWIEESWEENFGDVHPDAFDRHDMDIGAIVSGEVDPGEVEDKFKMDGEQTPSVPAADGGLGAAVSPASHTPTQTPTGLAKAGPALSWDELKEAVERHWDPDEGDEDGEESTVGFEIHPDRVEPESLKNNHEVCAKIITGILRHEQDVIAGPLIEQRIEDYLGHKVTRADYESGLEYKINQYKPQIIGHLEDHPNITVETYYASEQTLKDQLPSYVEDLIDELHSNTAPDLETWLEETRNLEVGRMEFEDYDDWLEALRQYRVAIAKLSGVLAHGQFGDILEEKLDYPEEHYDDAASYLVSVMRGAKDDYTNASEHARYVVINEYADLDDGYRLDLDETETATIDFGTRENADGQMPLGERFTVIGENL
ncbi:hypothetical protein [Natrinema versiforme]|uniref:Uncharacterized protein n=1 Tax=Natrinema versiforme JCM 10478 TaxID=1227496 RepID=L9Y7E4_9EURY|nr:hypothetical protein [Natrinema versiforme]ELY68858.1 hypothetical protein C489_05813 [Natrinema versiforme JCM 10478]